MRATVRTARVAVIAAETHIVSSEGRWFYWGMLRTETSDGRSNFANELRESPPRKPRPECILSMFSVTKPLFCGLQTFWSKKMKMRLPHLRNRLPAVMKKFSGLYPACQQTSPSRRQVPKQRFDAQARGSQFRGCGAPGGESLLRKSFCICRKW